MDKLWKQYHPICNCEGGDEGGNPMVVMGTNTEMWFRCVNCGKVMTYEDGLKLVRKQKKKYGIDV